MGKAITDIVYLPVYGARHRMKNIVKTLGLGVIGLVCGWAALVAALPALHPYEVPELIALPVVGGYRPYLEWLRAETGAAGAGKAKARRQARTGKRKRKE